MKRSVKSDEHRLALSLMEEQTVRICVPVCVDRASQLSKAVARAADVGDLIELRLDCLDEDQLDEAGRDLGALSQATSRPIIVTFRPKEYGRRSAVDRAKRVKFWSGESHSLADLVDIEADLLISTRPDAEAVYWRVWNERDHLLASRFRARSAQSGRAL